MKSNIELLAPVGSMESLHAAVQNGANAVYLGGKLFNARQYASNFDYEELREAIKYSHQRGVKVYVTINILIDDSEMEEVIDYIRFLYEIDVDGIIVQDLGMASIVRKVLPQLDIHGSTQMTINNLHGVLFLEDLGFKRVVLARETPIDEIKHISGNSSIELEGFIHGALCVSYSGQCLMSSMIGGRSGNRGKCAQPCRMSYSIVDSNNRLVKDWAKKHILSPKDLNNLEDVEELISCGLSSLKIEGRMKRPEYVATVVKNYRQVLDLGTKSLTSKDKQDVAQMFNRGFTKGVAMGDFGKDFVSFDRPDNRGILIGKVARVDKYKVYVLLEEDIEQGDGIEFELANGEYKGIKAPFDGKKGTTMHLEKPGYILKDSLVYKTSSISLLEVAKASYGEENIKYPINMEIQISIGHNPKLILMYKNHVIIKTADNKVEKGERISLSEEKVKEQLSKLGDTNFYLDNLNINLDEGSFLPLSVLNQLRREAIEELYTNIQNFNTREEIIEEEYIEKKSNIFTFNKAKSGENRELSIKVNNINQFRQLDLEKLDRIYFGFYEDIENLVDILKEKDKEVYIWSDKILYERDLDKLNRIIKPLENKIDGVSVSNLGTLKYIKDRYNLKIHGDIGLNIFNSFTVDYLKTIGLESMTLSTELTLGQIRNIAEKTSNNLETIVYGYLPVMAMKHCPMSLVKGCKDDRNCKSCNFASGYSLKDRMDITFTMERNDGISTIYNSVPLMILDSLDTVYKSGISMARLDFTTESQGIRRIQNMFYDYTKGFISHNEAKELLDKFREENKITNGHYFRGII